VFRGLDYIFGTHPASNVSFVTAVGTRPKKMAYGSNRGDMTFIAGGPFPLITDKSTAMLLSVTNWSAR
jgi:endoglucanase